MIITVGGIKGGGGKSVTATNLIVMRRLAGVDALLVDADEQGSAAEFADQRAALERGTIPCVRLNGKAVREQVRQLAPRYADIIIDTGGRDTASQRAALSVSDLALLPFQPGNFDLWTKETVEALIEEVRTINPGLRALAYISRGLSQGTDNAQARELLATSAVLELAEVTLVNRKAVNSATGEGLAVVELQGRARDPKAEAEMRALYRAVFGGGDAVAAAD